MPLWSSDWRYENTFLPVVKRTICEPRNSPLRNSETRPCVSLWLQATTLAWNGSPYFTSCGSTIDSATTSCVNVSGAAT